MKALELWHLQELLDNNSNLYSPDGERMIVVGNGFFHGQLFYEPKNKKVFGLKLVDLTKNAGSEFVEQCEYYAKRKRAELGINKKNIDQVLEVVSKEL